MMSNSVCLKEELLNGAECSFVSLCASLYYPGPGIAFLLQNTLFFWDFPKTKAMLYCQDQQFIIYKCDWEEGEGVEYDLMGVKRVREANSSDNHILQIQKQLREATAAIFFLPLKSQALVLRRQSIFWRAGTLPGMICLETVAFLQLSSNWVWAAESTSSMWKVLLQLPVRRVLPSGEQARLNLSKIASFSNISHSLPFTPSCTTMFCSGFLALQRSQIFTVRQSRVARYFPFRRNSPPEQAEIMSVMKFFCCEPVSFLKLMALLSASTDSRRSHILSVPRLVPYRKRLSEEGCSLEKVMFSLTSSIFSLPRMSTATKGRSASSSPQRQAWTSSLERTQDSLLEREMELMLERCLLGKVLTRVELRADSTFWSLGMLRSLPADLTSFFSVFSKIFQSLMLLELEVSILRYLPWLRSQLSPVISSSTSILRSGSNSFVCDWNSVKYSYSCSFFLVSSASKMMMRPARSPRLRYLPEWSNFITEIISSSIIFSLGPLYPNSCVNLQLPPLLAEFFYIIFSSTGLIILYSPIQLHLTRPHPPRTTFSPSAARRHPPHTPPTAPPASPHRPTPPHP